MGHSDAAGLIWTGSQSATPSHHAAQVGARTYQEGSPGWSASQRSLLAEVETQALWHGSPVARASLDLAGRRAGTIYSYERRVLGTGIGIRDGVVLLHHGTEGLSVPALADRVRDAAPAYLATFRIVGPASIGPIAGRGAADDGRTMAMAVPRDIQEVLPIGSSFAEFLQTLGRSTRRNVRDCRRMAGEAGIGFGWSTDGPTARADELKHVCRYNMPTPSNGRRVGSVLRFISEQPRRFHAELRDADGRLINLGGGFIEGALALMLYQYNHRAYRSLNPSLMLRSYIIERLHEQAVRNLAFVGRCSGLLTHVCERVPAAEMLIARKSSYARLAMLACRIAEPKSRIARVLAPQAGLTGEPEGGSG